MKQTLSAGSPRENTHSASRNAVRVAASRCDTSSAATPANAAAATLAITPASAPAFLPDIAGTRHDGGAARKGTAISGQATPFPMRPIRRLPTPHDPHRNRLLEAAQARQVQRQRGGVEFAAPHHRLANQRVAAELVGQVLQPCRDRQRVAERRHRDAVADADLARDGLAAVHADAETKAAETERAVEIRASTALSTARLRAISASEA